MKEREYFFIWLDCSYGDTNEGVLNDFLATHHYENAVVVDDVNQMIRVMKEYRHTSEVGFFPALWGEEGGNVVEYYWVDECGEFRHEDFTKPTVVSHERAKMVRAMDFICNNLTNPEHTRVWLIWGVADGDIQENTPDEELEYYCDDRHFPDLMALYMRIMRYALEDNEFLKETFDVENTKNGDYLLCCDDIFSEQDKEFYGKIEN